MKSVTLDTNCIYDLEEGHPSALWINRLVRAHDSGLIELRVPELAASEIQRGGGHMPDFAAFRKRLSECGLGAAKILRAMAYWDVTYIDWCVQIGPEMLAEERRIHEILFPRIEFDASAFYAARGSDRSDSRLARRWRNAKCDVQAMWCHIHNDGQLFVTRDANFRKPSKKARLEALGAAAIVTPEEAVANLRLGDVSGAADVPSGRSA